jgi:D-alanyl-D-alanine carboxypeptidase (penicillin-binding protein 5/6)
VGKTFRKCKLPFVVMTIICTLLSSILFVWVPTVTYAAEEGSLNLEVDSAILMDATSGLILYEKNANESLPPASMTKMMTAYLVLDAIESGKLSWDDPVRASDYAFYLGSMKGASVVFLANGAEYTVRQMFEAMEINSANDATLALAEKVGTTEQLFVDMMNQKAKELGMNDTLFVNSTGLSTKDLGKFGENAQAEENLLSAHDLAILARALVTDHSEILQFSSVPKKEFPNGVLMRNYNEMVPGRNSKHTYEGLDGLKTGHTQAAQYCFTGTAQRGELRLISVVMGAETNTARFTETRKLLDYGFNNYEHATVIKGKDALPGAELSPVQKGVELTVPVVAQKSLSLATRKGETDQYTFKTEWDEQALVAPIKAGQVVGKASLFYKDNETGLSVSLIAQEDIEEASWIRLLFRAVKDWFGSIFNGIKGIF